MSSDEEGPGECCWCGDNRGFYDRPHLDEGRRFSIKLEKAFDCDTVSYDAKCFFRNEAQLLLLQRVIFVFYNSTSLSHAMQDAIVGKRSNFQKKILRTRKIMVMHSNERG